MPKCLQNTYCPYSFLTVYEINNDLLICTYCYIEHKTTGFAKLMDMGGNGNPRFLLKKMDMGGIFYQKIPDMDGYGSFRTG